MEEDIISNVRQDLKDNVDGNTKAGSIHYFKESILFYGVKTAIVSQIAKKYFPSVKALDKNNIFALCEELFKSDYNEEAFIACEWAYRLRNEYEVSDFALFERWISEYINNWAKCDTFCNHTLAFVDKYPQFVEKLKAWAKSDNRWIRRAAAVTLIIPAKQGKFLDDIFQIADTLLQDRDDLVQKGYGWLLKDTAIKHSKEVFDYVMKNKRLMPRTALRYAIERLPDNLKKKAMQK